MCIYICMIFVCTCETMQECQERCISLGEASFSVSVWFVSCLYVSDICMPCFESEWYYVSSSTTFHHFLSLFPLFPFFFFSPFFLCSLPFHFLSLPSLVGSRPTNERERADLGTANFFPHRLARGLVPEICTQQTRINAR